MSSLKPEDAVSDYSTLDEKDMKVLDDWHSFFSCVSQSFVLPYVAHNRLRKRYNVVGKVSDGPVINK